MNALPTQATALPLTFSVVLHFPSGRVAEYTRTGGAAADHAIEALERGGLGCKVSVSLLRTPHADALEAEEAAA